MATVSKTDENQTFEDDEIQSISNRLKETLSNQLKSSVQIWNTLANNFNNNNENFFESQNVKIVDSDGRPRRGMSNFGDMFSNHQQHSHISILGEDGIGKSTFVQKLAFEWIDGREFWTKKFSFLFYFSLNNLNEEQTESLFYLLKDSVSNRDLAFFHDLLENRQDLSKILLIFDGLDEFRHHFCDEINDALIGRRRNGPVVVVTAKPANHFLEKFADSVIVTLNGYKNNAVQNQLENHTPGSDVYELRHILKNPFYHSLYRVVREDASIRTVNFCSLVERYVKFLGRKYRRTNSVFSEFQENELALLLGQYAEYEFGQLEVGQKIERPNLAQKFVNLARNVGYVKSDSTENRIIFPHRIVADYFAACYWSKRHHQGGVQPKDVAFLQIVEFASPQKALCSALGSFSCFLSYFNRNYKTVLWNNFTEYVPLLDEYETQSPRPIDTNSLTFPSVISSRTMRVIFDKLRFANTQEIGLFNARFDKNVKFENLTKFAKLYLFNSTFDLEPAEFFQSYNSLVWLDLMNCTWEETDYDGSAKSSVSKEYKPKHKLYVQVLRLFSPDGQVSKFLKFAMEECRSLREFQLTDVFEIDTEWVTSLNANETLLKSLQVFVLSLKSPLKLLDLFNAVSKMPNLLELSLTNCYTSEEEIEILSKYFENGAKKLRRLRFEDDANVGRDEALMKSLCNLSALQHLDISDCRTTEDSLKHLRGIFASNSSKIQTCSFTNEKALNKNSSILPHLNSCRSLTEVTFDKCGFTEVELELAKSILNNFSYESKKVLRGATMESIWRFFK